MKLALDAMGGDFAPAAAVEGAMLFAREHPQHQVLLVGDERRVREALASGEFRPTPNVAVRHATEVVEMADPPTAIRTKKDSSLRVCFELCREREAAAVVSAGNSGAVMAGALWVLGRVKGIDRPAIAALLPTLKGGGRCLLLDAGANVECRPLHLAQFALMGAVYVRELLGVERPRVAVLSNGEEDSKGTELTRETLEVLRRSGLEVAGYVEGRDLFSGKVEVVVTDGFTGNVVLKTTEGTAMAVAGMLRHAIEGSGLSEKLGALLLKPTFLALKKMIDYAEYGGAPLLGIDGVGIVAHGRSNPKAIKNALNAALLTAEAKLPAEIARAVKQASAWMPSKRAAGETPAARARAR